MGFVFRNPGMFGVAIGFIYRSLEGFFGSVQEPILDAPKRFLLFDLFVSASFVIEFRSPFVMNSCFIFTLCLDKITFSEHLSSLFELCFLMSNKCLRNYLDLKNLISWKPSLRINC